MLRYGLVLTVPALLALTVISVSSASAATKITRPSAPRHVTAVAGDNSAIVRFVAPSSNGGSRIARYLITVHPTGTAIRRCSSTRCSILGLSNGVRYYFTVAAINRFGRSAYSTPSNPVAPTAPTAPAAPAPTPLPTSTSAVTVTFIANGGSGSMANETEDLNTASPLSANTFVYAGYTFTGWNTSPTGSGTSYANDATYTFATSVTLYAQWSPASPTGPFTGTTSSNWSGYVLPTSSVDSLTSGEWTVPTLDCADTPNGSSATWVGIGGDGPSSGALLQTGIEDDCVNGVQVDSGWFEIVPSTPNYQETFSGFPVSPGDTIEAIVGYVNGQWVTVVENLNTGLSGVFLISDGWEVVTTATSVPVGGMQGYATNTSYSGAYSAEWIEEDVTNASSGSLFSLPNYGSVTFFNLRTNLPSWSLTGSDAVEIMTSNGVVVSVPGPVSNDGFTVTFTGS